MDVGFILSIEIIMADELDEFLKQNKQTKRAAIVKNLVAWLWVVWWTDDRSSGRSIHASVFHHHY